jgi:hypothetical protein
MTYGAARGKFGLEQTFGHGTVEYRRYGDAAYASADYRLAQAGSLDEVLGLSPGLVL